MTYKDKTFCASPNCKDECGRKMTDEEMIKIERLPKELRWVAWGYFCGEPEEKKDGCTV